MILQLKNVFHALPIASIKDHQIHVSATIMLSSKTDNVILAVLVKLLSHLPLMENADLALKFLNLTLTLISHLILARSVKITKSLICLQANAQIVHSINSTSSKKIAVLIAPLTTSSIRHQLLVKIALMEPLSILMRANVLPAIPNVAVVSQVQQIVLHAMKITSL